MRVSTRNSREKKTKNRRGRGQANKKKKDKKEKEKDKPSFPSWKFYDLPTRPGNGGGKGRPGPETTTRLYISPLDSLPMGSSRPGARARDVPPLPLYVVFAQKSVHSSVTSRMLSVQASDGKDWLHFS